MTGEFPDKVRQFIEVGRGLLGRSYWLWGAEVDDVWDGSRRCRHVASASLGC
jgi:hypothetical protein